jgi:hypothetical protein
MNDGPVPYLLPLQRRRVGGRPVEKGGRKEKKAVMDRSRTLSSSFHVSHHIPRQPSQSGLLHCARARHEFLTKQL